MAGETLLIVDDDSFMRDLLREALADDGFTVVAEESGAGAISAINHNEFQIALIDLSLPDVNGMDLVKSITDAAPETHIIIMTGYPSLDTAIQAIRQGARDYVVKPFKLPEVRGAVQRALQTRKLETEVLQLRRRVRELEAEKADRRPAEPRTRAQAPAPRRSGAFPGAYGGAPRPAAADTPSPDASADGEPLATDD